MHCVSVDALRFTQTRIKPWFKDGRPCANLVKELVANPDYVKTLKPLRIVRVARRWVCLDNRRLGCLLLAGSFLNESFTAKVRVWNKKRVFRSPCQEDKFLSFIASASKGCVVYVKHGGIDFRPPSLTRVIRVRRNKWSLRTR